MPKFKLALAVALAPVMFGLFNSPVLAQSQDGEQGQYQSQLGECRYVQSGAYGQEVELVCEWDQEQGQYQRLEQDGKVVYVDGREIVVHEPIDTALDLKSSLAAIGVLMTGAMASIIKIKNRVA